VGLPARGQSTATSWSTASTTTAPSPSAWVDGHNLSGAQTQAHMHNGLWRVDVNLDGPATPSTRSSTSSLSATQGPEEEAKTVVTPFNEGREGGVDWNARSSRWCASVNEQRKNKQGKPLTYDLVPLRHGNARHYGGDRGGLHAHDFWVTRARPGQIPYPESRSTPPRRADQEHRRGPVAQRRDAPRAAAEEPVPTIRNPDGLIAFVGVTHMGWTGFSLRPAQPVDGTPLFPYKTRPY